MNWELIISAVAKQDPNTKLLGSSAEEEAKVLEYGPSSLMLSLYNTDQNRRWSSFANSELLPPIMAWINPVIGKAPSSPEILEAAAKHSEGMVSVVENALAGDKKYLVGEELTMADLFVIAALARGYQFVSYYPSTLTPLPGDLQQCRCSPRTGLPHIPRFTNTICV